MSLTDTIYWHQMAITKQNRQALHGHKSTILWFTGLSGSGKSSIANEVEQRLHQQRISTFLLDGDNLRHGLNSDLGFSPEDRSENIRRIGEMAKLLVDSGIVVLAAFVSPYKSDRERIKTLVKSDEFIEIYVKCSLETCEARDPKGLYKKARQGQIKDFTGISAPYEEPEHPNIILNSDRNSIETCADQIIEHLSRAHLLHLDWA